MFWGAPVEKHCFREMWGGVQHPQKTIIREKRIKVIKVDVVQSEAHSGAFIYSHQTMCALTVSAEHCIVIVQKISSR